jgi:hypothetical protein
VADLYEPKVYQVRIKAFLERSIEMKNLLTDQKTNNLFRIINEKLQINKSCSGLL